MFKTEKESLMEKFLNKYCEKTGEKMTFKYVHIECKSCYGNGKIRVYEDLFDNKYNDGIYVTCVACGGDGFLTLRIPRVSWIKRCPHCEGYIDLFYTLDSALNILQGHSQDLTNWKTDDMKIAFSTGNTRFVEHKYKEENRIELYNTYLEKNRLGNYHGYWNKKDVKKIIKYLTEWLLLEILGK